MSDLTTKYARSRERMVAGVCSMLARELKMDVGIVRLITAAAMFFTSGTALVLYLIAWAVLPVEGETRTIADEIFTKGKAAYDNHNQAVPSAEPGPAPQQAQQPVFDPYTEN